MHGNIPIYNIYLFILGKKTRQTEEEVGRQYHGMMDRPEVRQVTEGGGEQRRMEDTGFEVICGVRTTSRLV